MEFNQEKAEVRAALAVVFSDQGKLNQALTVIDTAILVDLENPDGYVTFWAISRMRSRPRKSHPADADGRYSPFDNRLQGPARGSNFII